MKAILIMACTILISTQASASSYSDAVKLFQDKKYNESLKIIAGELSVDKDMEPDSPNYNLRFLAAHIHWRLRNFESAITHFKKCMEIKTNEIAPYIDIALMLIDMKRYPDAELYANRGLKIKKDAMFFYILGRAAMANKNYERAKAMFEKANSIDPGIYVSYNSLGMALMRLGRYSQANTAFLTALALMPDSAEILNNIALTLESMGKPGEALDYAAKAKSLEPNNTVILANLERIKGKAKK